MSEIAARAMDIDEPSWLPEAREFAQSALDEIGAQDWLVSLIFCSDAFMQGLNREYRKLDEPTDVLSFPMGERTGNGSESQYLAGDIVISPAACERNCAEFGVDFREELGRLIVHGLLHLEGMDHEDEDPGRPMLRRQEEILGRLSRRRLG